MKLRWLLLLALTLFQLVPYTRQDGGLRLSELVVAEDGGDQMTRFDPQKEDIPLEEGEPMRKLRARNGSKRRRRMRKRYRTTTELPFEDQNENLNLAEQNVQPAYEQSKLIEEPVTNSPLEETTRRRQNKRRRKIPRKQKQEDVAPDIQGYNEPEAVEETPKPLRRRRKGGRRRKRPQMTTTEPNKLELYIETTMLPPEVVEITTEPYLPDKNSATEWLPNEPVVVEVNNVPAYPTYDQHNLVSQSSVDLAIENNEPPKFPEIKLEDEDKPLSSSARPKPYSSKPAINTIKPVKEFIEEAESDNSERHEDHTDNEVPSQTPISQPHYHTFDRKTLFSKSRKLPPTSAIIRKKVSPRQQNIQQETESNRPVLNYGRWRDSTVKNEVAQKQLIPEGFTVEPLTMEPSKLIEKLKAQANAHRFTTQIPTTIKEESDRPKFDVKREKYSPTENTIRTSTEIVITKERFNKVVELHRSRGKVVIATPQHENPVELKAKTQHDNPQEQRSKVSITTSQHVSPSEQIGKVVITTVKHVSPGEHRKKVVLTTTKYEKPEEQTTWNVPLEETETTESGKIIVEEGTTEEQSTIPSKKSNLDALNSNKLNDSIYELLKSESANMELSEILEARNMTLQQLLEHREKGSKHFHLADIFAQRKSLVGENTTDSMDMNREEAGTPLYVEKQTILFPSQDILGSFQSFFSDKIERGQQNIRGSDNNQRKTNTIVEFDHREPRLFDSMPEFSDSKIEKKPPWKAHNPELKPVSIRGDYEEIQISLHPSENSVDNEFVVEDKAEVLRTNRVTSSLEADPINLQDNGFSKFRKIPVTVKSAIIISTAILLLAIFGFLSVLISCRLRQKKARLRAKQEMLSEHLKNEDFMNSQQSLSPVLTKQQQRGPVFTQNNIHSNTTSNRHYYLWRTLRKTFQYD